MGDGQQSLKVQAASAVGDTLRTPFVGSMSNVAPASSNDVAQAELAGTPTTVSGTLGRLYNAVLGRVATDTSVPTIGFSADQLNTFLKYRIKAFDDDFTSRLERNGAVAAIMEECDANKDGHVSWAEFQTYKVHLQDIITPGADAETALTKATAQFNSADKNHDGKANYDELYAELTADIKAHDKKHNEATAHADLVAELGALTALFLSVPTSTQDPLDRTVTLAQWQAAAVALGQ